MESISKILIAQRIRNRIIECFEDFSSFEFAKFGTFNAINAWDDWVFDRIYKEENYPSPIFSEIERKAIRDFCEILSNASDATKIDIFNEEQLKNKPEWVKLVKVADAYLKTFEVRGRFSEEAEEF